MRFAGYEVYYSNFVVLRCFCLPYPSQGNAAMCYLKYSQPCYEIRHHRFAPSWSCGDASQSAG